MSDIPDMCGDADRMALWSDEEAVSEKRQDLPAVAALMDERAGYKTLDARIVREAAILLDRVLARATTAESALAEKAKELERVREALDWSLDIVANARGSEVIPWDDDSEATLKTARAALTQETADNG